jgi:fusion and transport protein UGO1
VNFRFGEHVQHVSQPQNVNNMASVREGSNPLRPYYIPPSIGLPPEPTSAPKSASNGFNGSTSTYAASAREIFSDIDYSDYVSEESKSTVDMVKSLLDQAVYKYTSVLLAQPFEVAKTVLQVRTQAVGDGGVPVTDEEELRSGSYRDSMYGGVRCSALMNSRSCADP